MEGGKQTELGRTENFSELEQKFYNLMNSNYVNPNSGAKARSV